MTLDKNTWIHQSGLGWYWRNEDYHRDTWQRLPGPVNGTGPFRSREEAVRDENRTMAWHRRNPPPCCPACGRGLE